MRANLFTIKNGLLILTGVIILLLTGPRLAAQQKDAVKKGIPPATPYSVSQTQAKIKIDGLLNDTAWQEATVIELPYEYFPGDNTPAPVKTQCLVTYSKRKLYVAFRCFDPEPQKIRAHLMDRDALATFLQDDFVAFFVDTFNDERRAFDFRVNPMGVQVDGIYSEWDLTQDFSWDAIWASAGKITDFGYSVEIAIPFNQLRFPSSKEIQTWGFSFERSYPRRTRIRMKSHAVNRNIYRILPINNKVTGFEKLETGSNIEIVPTLTLNRTDRREDFPAGELETGKIKVEPGISGRWGVTSNLILNATINPDFSQVEADAAQLEINTRFALKYPEKRPFYLEGADFFQTPLEAVFTRTVYDPLWGVKMTGKIGKSAVGFFLNQDRHNNLLFPTNQGSYSVSLEEKVLGGVVRYRHDVGKGSTLGLLYTGRTNSDYHNHVTGLDGFFQFSKADSLNFQYLYSHTRYSQEVADSFSQPTDAFSGSGISANFNHNDRNLSYGLEYENLSANFRADYGFVPRVDFKRYAVSIQPTIWGKRGGWFNNISFMLSAGRVTDQQNELTDQNIQVSVIYQGPMQTYAQPLFWIRKERYYGVIYNLKRFQLYSEMKPRGGLKLSIYSLIGDAVDYSNARPATSTLLNPAVDIAMGKHLNLNINHYYERLALEGKKIYTANLLQVKAVYNFNVKTFFRATVQYLDISRNTDLYLFPIAPDYKTLFTQLLLSYKLNPQTVLFLGYSDNHMGVTGIDLTRNDRTFFLKVGYALGL